jgi:iron-sulfur cluster repair protein YtfE (RIC family)
MEAGMNAIELLTQDHEKVKKLFEEAQRTSDMTEKTKLFDQIDTELAIHAEIEEAVFYPALEQHDELKEMVAEAREEHEQVEELLLEIEDLATEGTDFDGQLSTLKETVEHHVSEEEGEMFPKVRDVLAEDALDQLGRELESAKGKHTTAGRDDLQMA